MLKIPFPASVITYVQLTNAEWTQYPKDNFQSLIRRWCERHNFTQYVDLGRKICTRLPYRRKDGTTIEVATDFLQLADAHHASKIFTPSLL